MISMRKRKKKLYSGRNAPLMFALLDSMIRKSLGIE